MVATCTTMQLKGANASFVGKAARSANASRISSAKRLIVRAEQTSLAKAERIQKAGGLYMNFVSDQSLSYLDGTLPGDFGFDPLGLSDPEGAGGFITPEWLAYSEVIHCRWAMLGAAGCMAPEILSSIGAIPQTGDEALWFKTGVIPPVGTYDKFWADPYTLFFIEVVLMQFAELRRWQEFKKPGSNADQYFLGFENAFKGTGNPSYPGGPIFNFMGLGKSSDEAMNKMKAREIKNGRLAMLAMFGFGAQAIMTGQGPIANLGAHLADPVHNNMLGNFSTVLRGH